MPYIPAPAKLIRVGFCSEAWGGCGLRFSDPESESPAVVCENGECPRHNRPLRIRRLLRCPHKCVLDAELGVIGWWHNTEGNRAFRDHMRGHGVEWVQAGR